MANTNSYIFYRKMGEIFYNLAQIVKKDCGEIEMDSRDVEKLINTAIFLDTREVDQLILFISKHLPEEVLNFNVKNYFLQFCDFLDIYENVKGTDVTADKVFSMFGSHYYQLKLIPGIYHLMHHILFYMDKDIIDLSNSDKIWLRNFLKQKRIYDDADWVDDL